MSVTTVDDDGKPLPGCEGGPPHLRARFWQDHQQCMGASLKAVWEADGAAIQGIGERKRIRNGHRYVKMGGHGGKRARRAKFREPKWLHPDARPAKRVKLEQSVQRASATL